MKPIRNKTYKGDKGKQYIIETPDDLENFLECIESLQKRSAEIGTAMLKVQGRKTSVDANDVKFDNQCIEADTLEYLGCSEWNNGKLIIPEKYFFDDNFIEKAEAAYKERKTKEAEKRRRDAEGRKKKAEEAERAQYLRLKERFG